MPRKQQGWITFQSSDKERLLLEQHCQQQGRTKTEVLRELLRGLDQQFPSGFTPPIQQRTQEHSSATEVEFLSQQSEYKSMKISARNTLKGKIKKVVTGAVNTEITIEIAPGIEIVSIITSASVEHLGLAEGKEAYAVIKSSNVMIATD